MTKRAGDPSDVLTQPKVNQWLTNSEDKSWFIAGHTRMATTGRVCRRNSHPFRYGRIIGSHNGMVTAPQKFEVDSEVLFWSLNKNRGDYQKGLKDIAGYFGLSWFDGADFYLLNHNCSLAICELDGVYYYSSDADHLQACTGVEPRKFTEGEVWRFNVQHGGSHSCNAASDLLKFESTATEQWESGYYGRGSYGKYSSNKNSRNYSSGGRGGAGRKENSKWWNDQETEADYDAEKADEFAKDSDAEWQSAWSDYCSLHAVSDDEFGERYAG